MDLNNDDVISMEPTKSLTGTPTFLVEEALNKWKSRFLHNGNPQTEHFYFCEDGVKCKMLSTGSEWRKGKIRFRLEFIPDNTEKINIQSTASDKESLPAQSLDALRSQLNI
jgi:KGK domain